MTPTEREAIRERHAEVEAWLEATPPPMVSLRMTWPDIHEDRGILLAALTEAEAERDRLRGLVCAVDDWFDNRGGNPTAALREAVRVYRSQHREATGRWYDPEVARAALRGEGG